MKHGLKAAFVAGAMLLAAVVPAGAATPGGNGLEEVTATCAGQETTVTVSSGAAFWVDGHKYSITSFSGTFTPADGSEPQSFTKVSGNKTGKADNEINCTGSETGDEGTFEFDVVAVQIR